MKTLLLDVEEWDLVSDVTGNIAVASEPYALAQDAASEIRTFRGEVWYDTSKGVPYLEMFLGRAPALTMLKAKLSSAAMLVSGVVAARCFVRSVAGRNVRGQVQVADRDGVITKADF